jgi:hypothetical protein
MNLDLSPDLAAIADGLESITVEPQGSSAESPGAVVPHALRRAMTVQEAAASGGRYTTADVVWHLPVAELAQSPRPGDVIRDGDGGSWLILEVARTTLRTRWRCTCTLSQSGSGESGSGE